MSDSNLDYKKLKFKLGLEIHQQLDTNKLFCSCPSILRNDNSDFQVLRKLHTVAGESGEVDIAVTYQASLKKQFIYYGYNDTTCLVELDEEPPHQINKEALKIALQIAILLNCTIITATQIMRKTVIDGSNTSGFQRTVLIARDGWIETSFGRVGIQTICLEEDSARKINDDGKNVFYKLDRLGIPLVEIVTSPDINSPEQAKEVALHIGEVLRSCKVKRGIGTIRQDVNISIMEGNRVELKGVQDMKLFIKIIESEIKRQLEIYQSGKEIISEVRNVLPGNDGMTEFIRPMPGADRMYPETDLPLLKISRDFINEIKKDLPKLKSSYREEFRKQGLHPEMIQLLFKQNKIDLYKDFYLKYQNPNFIVKMILLFPKEISKKLNKDFDYVEDLIKNFGMNILSLLKDKKISESDVKNILMKLALGTKFDDAVKKENIEINNLEEQIFKIIKSKPGLSENAYMGLVMSQMKGKVDGKIVMEIIKKLVK